MSNQSDPMDCVCFNTRKTARLLGQMYDRALEPSGLKNTQFTALAVAERSGPISITDLSRAMDVERTTLTRNLQLLERDGLVKLGAGVDGRSKTIMVTARGRSSLKKASPLWEAAQEQVLGVFGRKRWKFLRAELNAVRANLRGME
jgi:DNA-binding MarR family transcriptional regulator